MSEELKGCPFCPEGGTPYVKAIGNEHTKEQGADVGCTGCGFTKHIRVIYYSCEWAMQRAIEAWNTRTHESEEAAHSDMLAEVLKELHGRDVEFFRENPWYRLDDHDTFYKRVIEALAAHEQRRKGEV